MEWDDATRIIEEELPKQFFPETATWGLRYHENKWQLPVRENLSYEERRQLIYQKRDFKAPMTPYKMEEYLQKIAGAEVHVMDCHDPGEFVFVPEHPNRFKIVFVKEGTLDSKAVIHELNRIKQSHTVYCTIEDRVIIVVDCKEVGTMDARQIGIKFSVLLQLNQSRAKTTASINVSMQIKEAECVGNVTVTKTRNLCFFDGSVNFDGSKIMNSIYQREEVL